MDTLFAMVLEWAGKQNIATVMLIIAIVWQNRGNQALVKALNKERQEHLKTLREEVEECKTDRAAIWQKMVDLASDVAAAKVGADVVTRRV